MNVAGFKQEQKRALLDLLIVGMYADRNLASAEDDRVQKVLDAVGFQSDYERQNFSDAGDSTQSLRHTGRPARQ